MVVFFFGLLVGELVGRARMQGAGWVGLGQEQTGRGSRALFSWAALWSAMNDELLYLRVCVFWFLVFGLRSMVCSLWFMVQGLGSGAWVVRFRVHGLGFRV